MQEEEKAAICEMCKRFPGTPFLWRYESRREGVRERANSFCTECAHQVRHMCTGKTAQLMQSWEVGYPVITEITPEGLRTIIKDGPASTGERLRFLVLKRDNYRCQLCGAGAQDGVRLAVDHKHPKSQGGPDTLKNLWTLCYPCNQGKGPLPL